MLHLVYESTMQKNAGAADRQKRHPFCFRRKAAAIVGR